MRTCIPLLLAAALLLPLPCALLPSRAQTTEPAPQPSPSLAAGSRILKTFDFEEKALGNYESIPMFWSKVAGHGFPAYSTGHFDPAVFRSPGNSFKLEIDGGSAAFQYSPGKLPINPSADYYVIAFVKTTPLKHARAQIAAFFADEKGRIIPESGLYSEPFATDNTAHGDTSGNTAPDWHILHLYIPGPGANPSGPVPRSLVLQLGLLQPQQLAGPAAVQELGKFALYQQDIKGAAWFDDITVFQLPRLAVDVPANVPGNIFSPKQNVDLDLTVSDLTSADPNSPNKLTANLKITDADGLLFATEKFAAVPTASAPWSHHFSHAPFPPGLYTASLDVSDIGTGTLIARRQTRFLCLAPAFHQLDKPAPEFGFTLPGGPSGSALWPQLPAILRHAGAGLVQIPAWRPDMSEDAILRRDPPFDDFISSLQKMGVHIAASFTEMPAPLSAKIADARAKSPPPPAPLAPPHTDSILALYDADPSLWRPYVSFLLARYANRIDNWEFGSLAAPFSGSLPNDETPARSTGADPRYPILYAKTTTELSALLNHPHLMIPWNALFEFQPKQYPGARLDLLLPTAIKPSQIPAYLENFKQVLSPATQPATPPPAADNPVIFAHIQSLDAEHYERSPRLADFAQRIVYARSANPAAIIVDLPLAPPSNLGRYTPRPEPDETFIVYRTLVQALAQNQFIRQIPLAPGVKAFLFDKAGVGTLILWNESAPEPQVRLQLPLGPNPRITDLLGNTRPLPVQTPANTSEINITSIPIILDQLDTRALELRASFATAAKTFPAGAGAVRTDILLANPYDDTLAGNLKITLPKGWSMDPADLAIALPPGSSLRRTVTIRYPYSELAGPASITARLASDDGRRFDFATTVAITSDVVELDASSQLLPNGDLVVQQVITNTGQVALNAQAYATVPGYPRQQRYLLDLLPGQTTIKRFVFPLASYDAATKETSPADIAAALFGKSATLGLRQNDGRTLITKSLPMQ